MELLWRERYEVTQTGCWQWLMGKSDRGYGLCWPKGRPKGEQKRKKYAHIHFYEYYMGGVPDGMELDHVCRNKACVNPDHLEAVPHSINIERGANSKITRGQVLEIRRLATTGMKHGRIAEQFGISRQQVCDIANLKVWRHVK